MSSSTQLNTQGCDDHFPGNNSFGVPVDPVKASFEKYSVTQNIVPKPPESIDYRTGGNTCRRGSPSNPLFEQNAILLCSK